MASFIIFLYYIFSPERVTFSPGVFNVPTFLPTVQNWFCCQRLGSPYLKVIKLLIIYVYKVELSLIPSSGHTVYGQIWGRWEYESFSLEIQIYTIHKDLAGSICLSVRHLCWTLVFVYRMSSHDSNFPAISGFSPDGPVVEYTDVTWVFWVWFLGVTFFFCGALPDDGDQQDKVAKTLAKYVAIVWVDLITHSPGTCFFTRSLLEGWLWQEKIIFTHENLHWWNLRIFNSRDLKSLRTADWGCSNVWWINLNSGKAR